jgi:citronellol/citronellal dehydrogenase
VERAGGKALPQAVDIRDGEQIASAVKATANHFGTIDILINNAGAIVLCNSAEIELKKYDLLQAVNVRGAFLCTKLCLPYLQKAENPHILMMAPPLQLHPQWFLQYAPYTLSKYQMSLSVTAFAAEFKKFNIAVNALWPKYLVATAATAMLAHNNAQIDPKRFVKPEIVADAAYEILRQPSTAATGQFYIDFDLLASTGVTDFSSYAVADPTIQPIPDFFIS